tara:strand:+ start:135 stop:422 length:288 start_codon:yes stop_codon:yes gene_type:complete
MTEKDRDEFIIMKSDIQQTKKDIESIKEDVKKISSDMSRITLSMFNDDLTGSEGIIQMTKRNGVRLTKLENVKVAIIGVFAAIISGLTLMIKSIF